MTVQWGVISTSKQAVHKLETLADGEGSISIGWLSERVLYARLSGGLSADLGGAYASRLHFLSSERTNLEFFADARALTHYDLLARSAFVRAVLANRRRFQSLTLLTWSEGLGQTGRSMMDSIGGAIEMLNDANEFEHRLSLAAPGSRQLVSAARR